LDKFLNNKALGPPPKTRESDEMSAKLF